MVLEEGPTFYPKSYHLTVASDEPNNKPSMGQRPIDGGSLVHIYPSPKFPQKPCLLHKPQMTSTRLWFGQLTVDVN